MVSGTITTEAERLRAISTSPGIRNAELLNST